MNYIDPKEANYRARLYINGGAFHQKTKRYEPIAGAWHPRFDGHPWVKLSNDEGWDIELRGHLAFVVTRCIMVGADYSDIKGLMPDGKWVEATRERAKVYRDAKNWRDGVCAKYGTMEAYYKAMRNVPIYSDFKPMTTVAPQPTASPLSSIIRNSIKRVDPDDGDMTLTERSKQMSGDREEYNP